MVGFVLQISFSFVGLAETKRQTADARCHDQPALALPRKLSTVVDTSGLVLGLNSRCVHQHAH